MAITEMTCHSSLRNYWKAALPFLVAAVYLIWYGAVQVRYLHRLAPNLDRTLVAPYWVAVGVGCLLLLIMALVLLFNLKKRVTVAPTGITCLAGRKEIKLAWRDVHAIFPNPEKRSMRTLTIQGGDSGIFRLEEFFFPDYSELSEAILEGTQGARRDRTYEL